MKPQRLNTTKIFYISYLLPNVVLAYGQGKCTKLSMENEIFPFLVAKSCPLYLFGLLCDRPLLVMWTIGVASC